MTQRNDVRLPVVEDTESESVEDGQSRRRWVRPAVVILGALIVFALHFRPWEVAFLEDWALSVNWTEQGPIGFARDFYEWSLGRPLHLVPTAIGLALAGGAPGGIFFVLGVVAVAQFVLVIWALRPVSRSFWISAVVAFFIASHPLWPGGFLQRFLPAQTAALAMIIAMGLLIRWSMQGRIRTVVGAGVVLVLGLCVYPGTAVAAPLLAVVIALIIDAPRKRRLITIAVGVGSSAVMTVYSLVVTRLIATGPGTYEMGNLGRESIGGPRDALEYIGTTLLKEGITILGAVFALAIIGAVLALRGVIPHWAGWVIAASSIISPLCAVVFFGHISWLQNIDRIGYATSIGLISAAVVWPATSRGGAKLLQTVLAAVIVTLSLFGAIRGVEHWQPYIQLQHQLLAELAPVVKEASGDEIVVVVDHTGTFGKEYTLPQYYMSYASRVMNSDDTPVWLCSLPDDPPLDSAPVCAVKDTGSDLTLMRTYNLPAGSVDIYMGDNRKLTKD